VDLVLDQVRQLEHVDQADGHRLVELLAGAPSRSRTLRRRQACLLHSLTMVAIGRRRRRGRDLDPDVAATPTQVVSRTWPRFMRLGTPSGLSTMSTGSVRQVRHVLRGMIRQRRPCCRAARHLVAGRDLPLLAM